MSTRIQDGDSARVQDSDIWRRLRVPARPHAQRQGLGPFELLRAQALEAAGVSQ